MTSFTMETFSTAKFRLRLIIVSKFICFAFEFQLVLLVLPLTIRLSILTSNFNYKSLIKHLQMYLKRFHLYHFLTSLCVSGNELKRITVLWSSLNTTLLLAIIKSKRLNISTLVSITSLLYLVSNQLVLFPVITCYIFPCSAYIFALTFPLTPASKSDIQLCQCVISIFSKILVG